MGAKQHYVPQFYLKNFSNNSKSIGMCRLDNKNYISNASIKQVAYHKNLYGEDGKLESILASLEAEWAKIIRHLIDKDAICNDDAYASLLLFITLSSARTLKSANNSNELTDIMMKELLQADGIDKKLEITSLDDFIIQDNIPNLSAMQVVAEMTCILTDLELLLIVNNSNRGFITSDNPIVKYNQFYISRNYQRDYGLGQRGLQIFVPLSPKISLCLYDSHVYKIMGKNKHIMEINTGSKVNELNKLFVKNSYQQIFFNNQQKESYIRSLTRNENTHSLEKAVKILKSNIGEVINYSANSIQFKIKLDFFKIAEAYKTIELPKHMGGLMRPIANQFIPKSN